MQKHAVNNSVDLFQLALQLSEPWFVKDVYYEDNIEEKKFELHIVIGFIRGAEFKDKNGVFYKAYDTIEKTWRHLNFFQYKCYLHCNVPRIQTQSGETKMIEVPWSRQNSGFTLLFEAFTMALIEKEMPVNKVGELLNEYGQRVWTIFNYWIDKAKRKDTAETVTKLGFDETSIRKGHNYITTAVDMEKSRVISISEGKGIDSVTDIKIELETKGIQSKQIEETCMDLSPAFISGVSQNFSNATICFDKFHVTKLLHEAMDEVRKLERINHDAIKGYRYVFLKNYNNLSSKQKEELSDLIELYPVIGTAYRLKELFKDLWEMESKEEAGAFLSYWCDMVNEAKIFPFNKFVGTLKAHWFGIMNYFDSRLTNGVLEGINNKIQLAKRRARGYRNIKNFINMIYFIVGKLKFDYPQTFIYNKRLNNLRIKKLNLC